MKNETVEKKPRIRKKRLYTCIREQMEFYFSDSNLDKDKFMNDLLKHSSEIDLEVFLKFNKINSLTTKIEEIAKAIEGSKELQLTDDKKRVYRVTERQSKNNVDDCTIYLEGLRPEATVEKIKEFFCQFGKIDYVALPRYKVGTKQLKGFAFVEFSQYESARNAIKYFMDLQCIVDKQPGNLWSNLNEKQAKDHSSTSTIEVLEHKKDDSFEKSTDPAIKKLKAIVKKKNYKIITKIEWKRLRDEYLSRQKMKTHKIKMHLRTRAKAKLKKDQETQKIEKGDDATKNEPVNQFENTETVVQSNSSKVLCQNFDQEIEYEDPIKDEREKQPTVQKKEKYLVNGVFVKFTLKKPCLDKKMFQNAIKTVYKDIMYVDVKTKATSGFLRFNDLKTALKYFSIDLKDKMNKLFSSFELLNDSETANYLIGVNKRLSMRYRKRKNVRGRDRLKKRLKSSMSNIDLV